MRLVRCCGIHISIIREITEQSFSPPNKNSYVVIEAYGQDLMSEETRRFEAAIRKYKKTVRDHRAIEREDENALHAKLHEKESELLYLSKMLTLQKSSLNSIDEAYIKGMDSFFILFNPPLTLDIVIS